MNDDVKIFVNNQIKEYFQSNVLSYFKYVNEDIKQIDKEIEQISEEQNRLSLVLSSDPTKITKKDRELIDIINAYISKVNNIKKDAEESLQQVINDLDSKAIKDKKDATKQLTEIKKMLKQQDELLSQLDGKKTEVQSMIDNIIQLSDAKIDKLLQEKSVLYLTEFNKAISKTALDALENVKGLIEKAERLNQKLSDSYEKMEEEINDSKDAIINAVVKKQVRN